MIVRSQWRGASIDERTPFSEQIQDRLITEAALVPTHWYLEVANVLAMAEKRNRITSADSSMFLELLGDLKLEIDFEFSARALSHLLPLCRRHRLTSYDAVYLDMGVRRGLPLASLDRDLCQAAVTLGIEVLGDLASP